MASIRATNSTRLVCNHLNSHSHEFIIQNQAGAVVDLTDYTVVLRLTGSGRVVTELGEDEGFVVTDAAAGKTLLSWAAGMVPLEVGSYTGEVVLSKTGARYSSTQFPKIIIT